jgi:hypothetical protein
VLETYALLIRKAILNSIVSHSFTLSAKWKNGIRMCLSMLIQMMLFVTAGDGDCDGL